VHFYLQEGSHGTKKELGLHPKQHNKTNQFNITKTRRRKSQKLRKTLLFRRKKKEKVHTCVLSLLTRASKPSLDTFAGKLTAGASDLPSSSDTK
jgi:hypothetical protein